MILVVATFDMSPADRARFIAQRAEQVERSRQEDGCLEYALCLDAFDSGRVRLIERWRDPDALAAHVSAVAATGGPPAGVSVNARRVMVVEGEVRSDTGGSPG